MDVHDKLDQITALMEDARAMPMSASALVNRAEVIGLLDELRDLLPEQLHDADLLLSASSADSTGADSGSTYLIYGRDFTGTVAQEGAIGNDTLTGTSAAENIVGGRGNDTLDGAAGIDALQGGAGDDTLYYDSIDRRIDGGNGEDSLRVTNGGASFDGSEHRVRNIETIDLRRWCVEHLVARHTGCAGCR